MGCGKLFVGTSGWVYPDWLGLVYPKDVKSKDIFSYYARHFRTVELNSTFYHFPRETTVEKWETLGGKGFTWSVKAWRWITHIKRLKGAGKDVRDFFGRMKPIARNGAAAHIDREVEPHRGARGQREILIIQVILSRAARRAIARHLDVVRRVKRSAARIAFPVEVEHSDVGGCRAGILHFH